ncbi:hypothetical protein AWC38_SpisGene22194 [Stylophora pistillata]|uniref:Uncharacterized protein n=1 Tax=Stylophora pistillata TaxID=50429 RepID=A0A2B4RBV0_STYPI|nr:hypothetical protein AWC38_SpisGene22194 [Stylophora pistillata]
MSRERKKRKRRERRLHKEKVLVSALQIEKDRFERQQKICDYMSRKYYNRLNSLLRREEAARKKSIVEEPKTQRKVLAIRTHQFSLEIDRGLLEQPKDESGKEHKQSSQIGIAVIDKYLKHHRLHTASNKHAKLKEVRRHIIQQRIQGYTQDEGSPLCSSESEEEYLSSDDESVQTDYVLAQIDSSPEDDDEEEGDDIQIRVTTTRAGRRALNNSVSFI